MDANGPGSVGRWKSSAGEMAEGGRTRLEVVDVRYRRSWYHYDAARKNKPENPDGAPDTPSCVFILVAQFE